MHACMRARTILENMNPSDEVVTANKYSRKTILASNVDYVSKMGLRVRNSEVKKIIPALVNFIGLQGRQTLRINTQTNL